MGDDDEQTVGERIKALRLAKPGLSQQRMADELGVHLNTVSNWERDVDRPRFPAATEIANYFKVPLRDVLGHDPPPDAVVPATDETVRDSFEKVAARISELHEEVRQTARRSDVKALKDQVETLALAVLALQTQQIGQGERGKSETAKPSAAAKKRPRRRPGD